MAATDLTCSVPDGTPQLTLSAAGRDAMQHVSTYARWSGGRAACAGPLGPRELLYRCTHPANVIGGQLKASERSRDGVRLTDRVLIVGWTSGENRVGWMSVRKEQGQGGKDVRKNKG